MTAPDRRTLYHITCADGLEQLLGEEVTELGATVVDHQLPFQQGRVIIEGTLETAYRICLWSRLASRVLLPLFTVPVERQDVRDVAEELFEAARDFDWSLVFSPQSTFVVRIQSERDVKMNSQFATLRVKDAVVDSFMDSHGRRPSIDTQNAEITLTVLAGLRNHTFSLDLSGDSLHRRGYRHAMTDAPLKENLAAAILRLANWHSGSNAKQYNTLIDPMCGSGTFIIEAMMMTADRAPGLNRRFGFFGWSGHDGKIWQNLKLEAQDRFEAAVDKLINSDEYPLVVYAFDADWEAVKATRTNLIAAGLERCLPFVKLEERTLADWPDFQLRGSQDSHPDQALIITNPPYGERLGDKVSNRALYQGLGHLLQKFAPNQYAAIIASQIEQADVLQLNHISNTRLMNGKLPIYIRIGQISAASNKPSFLQAWQTPTIEFTDENAGSKDFANRLIKNISNLKKQAVREGISNLRIYDADLPDFNLAIDLYGDQVHVQEYAPPKIIDPEKAKMRFNLALTATRQVLGLSREQVYIKTRARQKGNDQYEKKSDTGKRLIVQEDRARLYVNFTDYLDTGLFLDHRPMRSRIFEETRGKHFLNLYAYTCTASVQAALGGALSTTSVDLSNTYLDWGKNNFALNGLTVDHPDQQHQFFSAEVFEWLKEGSEMYDLIFIDPPTFSNSKKFFGTFDIQRDHMSLIKRAMNRLQTDGVLYFSNNFRRFELDELLPEMFDIKDITQATIGFDFKRNTKIHKAWAIRHFPL